MSPLGLVNDTAHQVIYLVASAVWESPAVNFHPNINSETLELTQEAFHGIIQACETEVRIMEFEYLVDDSPE